MIYFIRAGEDGPIKIGSTRSLVKRLRTLQGGNHMPLHVIRHETGGMPEERWLQGYFAPLLIAREWFRFHPEMLTIAPQRGWPESPVNIPMLFQTFEEVFAGWPSIEEMASDIGATVTQMEGMRKRQRVHHKYWAKLRRAAKARSIGDIPIAHLAVMSRRADEADRAAYQLYLENLTPRRRWHT